MDAAVVGRLSHGGGEAVTQPDDPYAEQRAAGAAAYAAYEQMIYAAYLEMMTEWLGQVQAAVLGHGVTALSLLPNPWDVYSTGPSWTRRTEHFVRQVMDKVVKPTYQHVLAGRPHIAWDTRPFVTDFAATVAANLAGLPEQVHAQVATIIQQATAQGASVPDVASQLRQLFAATDPAWANKAQVVAMTTLHTAYAGGTHDAYAALVADEPEVKWVHRWLATDDERTRPWHREADGQVQPWGQPFQVGPETLAFPGDPRGLPGNVIRCRCVELLEIAGEPTDMTDRQSRSGTAPSKVDPPRTTLLAAAAPVLLDPHQLCSLTACKLTGKPGLCKGQHRGETEPGVDIPQGGDARAAAEATATAKQLDSLATRIRASMVNWTPEQRARATSVLARYQQQSSAHKRIAANETLMSERRKTALEQAKRQAERDAREQDRLDAKRKATAKKINGVASGKKLKDYQTSTKV